MQALIREQRKADIDIILNEKCDILFKNKDTTNTFKEYFGSVVESLDLYIGTEESKDLPAHASDGTEAAIGGVL